MQFRVFKQVPRIIYGNNSITRVRELLPQNAKCGIVIYDSKVPDIVSGLPDMGCELSVFEFDASSAEPYTGQIDALVSKCRHIQPIDFIIGIGGGSTMDVAKAVSICLRNDGGSGDFQGWDLVKVPGIFKIGVPTIFGSGSEASRTAVLNNGEKKQGINSDHSMFDAIVLDPELSIDIGLNTKFYTAMDCYIHCVESISGTMINQLALGYATKALSYCHEYFDNDMRNEELICVGSFYGGVSIVNSEVGVCHALSYGLSTEFGLRHGLANCIVFKVLDDYYPDHVPAFRDWLRKYDISLPENLCSNIEPAKMQRMINQTLLMERPLTNALGENWKTSFSREKIEKLYSRM